MSSLLGGNSSGKQSSSSQTGIYNQAYQPLTSALTPTVNTGANATSLLSQLLGVNGPSAAGNTALNNFQASSGFQNQLDQGTKAITNNAATAGLLNSGATLKGLDTYGQGLAQQSFNNYLSQLTGVGTQGQQAASTLASSGGVTNTSSTSNGKTSTKTGLGI